MKAREAVVGLDLLLAAEALAGVVALDPVVKHPEQTENQVINNIKSDQYIFSSIHFCDDFVDLT